MLCSCNHCYAFQRVIKQNRQCFPGVSTQEEADTLLILHAMDSHRAGFTVHIYSQDTYVLLLALRRVPELGSKAAMLMGTHEKRRLIKLQPIYNALGPEKVRSVIKVHSLTGCDTTGRIFGKSKKKTFQAFLESNVDIIHAISQLGIGVVHVKMLLRNVKYSCVASSARRGSVSPKQRI